VQHIELVDRLLTLARKKFLAGELLKFHPEGTEYTSLMVCFFLHIASGVDTIMRLYKLNSTWFPTTNAFVILRSVFEADVTAHYISKQPKERAVSFVKYGRILKKKRLDTLLKHNQTKDETWNQIISAELKEYYIPNQAKIEGKYREVKGSFEFVTKEGKVRPYCNWANKTLRDMAKEVDHEIEYDIFYTYLSSFTHVDIQLADRFLKSDNNGLFWTCRADEVSVAFVFSYAATFFSCFLALMGRQFQVEIEDDLARCWNFN